MTHSVATRPLIFILLGFTVLWAVYVWLIPPFEGPDGPQHWAYVVWLVEQGSFPPQGAAAWQTDVQQEAGQPPLYYLLAAVPAWLVGVDDPPVTFQANPHFPSSAPGTVPDNKMVAVYEATRPQQGGWLALTLARVLSLLCGWLTILFTYALVRETWPHKPTLALAAAILIAVTPQVVFLSSVVSNDILAAAMGTLTLWQLARLIQRGFTSKRLFGLGLAWGLAALSKSNALLLGIPIFLAVGGWPLVVSRWPLATGITPRIPRIMSYVLWVTAGFILIAGWWYVRSWVLYGSPLGTEVHCYAPWAHCDIPHLRQNPLAEWREVFDSFWAAFGWGNIKFPAPVYLALGLLVIAAAVGLIKIVWELVGTRGNSVSNKQVAVNDLQFPAPHSPFTIHYLPFIILALCFIALLVEAVALEAWMRQVTAPHGRLLFPAVGAAALLLVTGWDALNPQLARAAWGPITALALFAPWILIYPAYFPARPQTRTQVLASESYIGWRYGEVVELLALRPQSRSVMAGDVLTVHACWQTLAAPEAFYTLSLQLVGPENQVVARRRTYPDLGRYPTTHWQPEVVYCEDVRVDIPADLPRTLRYEIEAAWLDEEGERLAAVDSAGNPTAATFAGQVRLQAKSTVVGDAAATQPIITLQEHTLPLTWHIGQMQTITLTWQINQAIPTDYTVFIHFRDATGQNVFTGDGPPLAGWYPTSWWLPGEIVPDRHTVTIPPDIPPGTYQLVVGWYEPLTNTRLGEEFPLGDSLLQP